MKRQFAMDTCFNRTPSSEEQKENYKCRHDAKQETTPEALNFFGNSSPQTDHMNFTHPLAQCSFGVYS
ncbi:hypothetical protein NL676_016713 [Syzygium grande]|nr:hypothetical protein NL676_016713 [Syzygium grande]